ncbi:hypothetical protein N7491_010883 [Penicillium cf. griseofulvum]|nr:hypothetical protein N7491_010883 [Penicillium cf. griseofulvum]
MATGSPSQPMAGKTHRAQSRFMYSASLYPLQAGLHLTTFHSPPQSHSSSTGLSSPFRIIPEHRTKGSYTEGNP